MHAERNPTGLVLGPEAVELLKGYGDLVGNPQHSQSDAVMAVDVVSQLSAMTVLQMLERMRSHLDWCQRTGNPAPRSLSGFWKTLRSENDFQRDEASARPGRARSPDGMAALGDVLRVVQGGAP
jgi:hypothetical protein